MSIAVEIFIIVILIVFSAFFSSAETALTTISPHRLRSLLDDNVKHAHTLEKVLSDKEKMLSVILICNNIVNIAASALTTVVVQELFGNNMVSVGTGVLTVLILIFGEISPKTMATYRAEKISLSFCPVIRALMIVFTPIAAAINFLAAAVLRLMGIKKSDKAESYTENEIRSIVEVSEQEGVIENEEKNIINNVFDFNDTTVREVMVPWINVSFVRPGYDYDQVMTEFKKSFFTRLPVINEAEDAFLGVINVKDLLTLKDSEKASFKVTACMRPIEYTYENRHLSELFIQMQRSHTGIMAVMDEYGDSTGIVTLEDLIEEIVGDIKDEYDQAEEEEIVKCSENEYTVKGFVSLADINERLDTDLESDNFDSIGGLLMERLDRLPAEGDLVSTGGCDLKVLRMNGAKVEQVNIKINNK